MMPPTSTTCRSAVFVTCTSATGAGSGLGGGVGVGGVGGVGSGVNVLVKVQSTLGLRGVSVTITAPWLDPTSLPLQTTEVSAQPAVFPWTANSRILYRPSGSAFVLSPRAR